MNTYTTGGSSCRRRRDVVQWLLEHATARLPYLLVDLLLRAEFANSGLSLFLRLPQVSVQLLFVLVEHIVEHLGTVLAHCLVGVGALIGASLAGHLEQPSTVILIV